MGWNLEARRGILRDDRRRTTVAAVAFAGSAGLIAYTFVGYPAIIALLARIRPRPVRADLAYRPSVSVVILAYNEEEVIDAKLANTLQLDYPVDRLEVIVVTDGSDDQTADRAARFARAKVLHRPDRLGKLAAMIHGAEVATGAVLVFSDANNRYTSGALLELVAPFADPEVGVVTGRKAIDDGTGRPLDRAEGLYWRYESKLKEWESTWGSVTAASGEILAFRREALPRIPSDSLIEDLIQVISAAQAGWRVVYAPAAVSLEVASATIADEATRRTRLVAGRWQVIGRLLPALAVRRPTLAWQLASHKLARPLVPAALAVLAASNAMLTGRSRWARTLAAGQLSFYAAALHGWRAESRGRRHGLSYLPYYFCRMNLATITGPISLMRGRQSVAWARVRRG